jgi:hypothetical protein
MPETPKCNWTGASGRVYAFFIHPLPASFNPNQDGNYIFSKETSPGKWSPIYIGEGDLASRVSNSHHQASCMGSKGATHVHAHLNGSEEARKAEEEDLLANYTNAYKPIGCNEMVGG